jgi:hypothetical protein
MLPGQKKNTFSAHSPLSGTNQPGFGICRKCGSQVPEAIGSSPELICMAI